MSPSVKEPTGIVLKLAALTGLVFATACLDSRDRPGVTGPGTDPTPQAELLAPSGDNTLFIAGRQMQITVQGAEEGGRLIGVGYEITRDPFRQAVMSDQVMFSPTAEAQQTFMITLPDTLPDMVRLLIQGFAVAQGPVRGESETYEIHVAHCGEGDAWC